MPRAKAKKPQPHTEFGPVRLSDEVGKQLLDLLSIEPRDKPDYNFDEEFNLQNRLHDVYVLLDQYKVAVSVLDNYPTPAYFRDRLGGVNADIDRMLSRLRSLDEWVRPLLAAWVEEDRAPSINEIEHSLESLRSSATHALETLEGGESRGRPAGHALQMLISGLREVFAREYRGGSTAKRKQFGSVTALSEREADEREFVKATLKGARIPHPQDLAPFFVAEPKARNRPTQGQRKAKKNSRPRKRT
jgi:hypothetical protein